MISTSTDESQESCLLFLWLKDSPTAFYSKRVDECSSQNIGLQEFAFLADVVQLPTANY